MSINKTEGDNKKKGVFSRLFSRTEQQTQYDSYEEVFMNSTTSEASSDDKENENAHFEEQLQDSQQSDSDEYQYELEIQEDHEALPEQNVLIAEKEEIEISAEAGSTDELSEEDASEQGEEPKQGEDAVSDEALQDANATAIFSFADELPEGSEVESEGVSISDIQDTAKSYYNENHDSTLDDKVDNLLKLASTGFEEEKTEPYVEHTNLGLEVPDEEQDTSKKKKRKRKEVVSNEDMEMLGSLSQGEQDDDSLSVGIGKADALGKKYEEMLDDNEPDVEYTDKAQEKAIISSLRKNAISAFIGVILSLAAFAACLYFETAAGSGRWHPAIFEPGRYGLVYAMSMLQIMFISVMFNLDGVIRGFKGLTKAKARPESIAVMTTIICTLHVIAGVTFASHKAELKTYCSVGCFALVLLAVNSFIKAYTALSSFCIAASKMPKYTTCELDATSPEAAAFAKYLEEDTTIFTVEKTDFISGFFKKNYACPEASKSSFGIYITSLVAGFVCAIASALLTQNAYTAISTGCAVSLAALPANLLISTALPFFIASLKSARTKTAFIGEAACDMYTNAGILSFDDSEVFPPKGVKVSSIRTYGDTRIDKVIIYMARIFNKLEGPLSYIFDRSVQDSGENIGDAEIISRTSDGIKVKIDDKEILLGTSSYLKLYDIHTPIDNIDESFLQSLGSIIYMATGSSLSAKFYIKYSMNQSFEKILRSLYDSGICAGVKTIDPCINNQLINGNLRGSGYPVSVIKRDEAGIDSQVVRNELPGSIISLTGTHNFLKGFIRLDALRNTYRSNSLIGRISAIIGIIVAGALTLTGAVSILSPTFFLVLGLLWCVPTVVLSLLTK